MFKSTLLAATTLGLLAAGCAGPYDRQASTPYNTRPQTASERNCADYGFTPGTGPFQRCVQREAQARESGRVNRDYAEARLLEDARGACYDYGLERGSQRYDNCVTREVDARRYREQGQNYSPTPSYSPNYVPARAPEPYYEQRPATTGVAVYRDEFGFRYDAEGNRVDGAGRIISPQSTTR